MPAAVASRQNAALPEFPDRSHSVCAVGILTRKTLFLREPSQVFNVTMATLDEIREEPITWRVHPARHRLGAACGAAVAIFAFAWLATDLMGNLGWGLFSGMFLFVMLNRFFLPSEFTLDQNGVTARYPWRSLQFAWHDVRRFLHDNRGGYISDRRRSSMFDAFRGIHLVFAENRDAVVARIKARIDKTEAVSR